ncbi:hypothetical protein HFP89_04180 [Wenzhouxiangella sp. XN79A]|uniref:right-handed parallel beta-helix repeat-containing protein n=1 Tax=Wenzhouxiangella sp. XN79A TaxID=2724193 RepID=UPI00144A7475|nr:right-handed parallel beta-helix repeat-containing protein [Wenzhouxiangella sp. XN79A]NKI34357.1 hypothetical protein [Wenzhouxiangella sp. XN79A]
MYRVLIALLALAALGIHTTARAQVSCGDVITTSRALTGDLHCTSGWTGIEIAAPGVTLDLNGHTLSGSIFQGVLVSSPRVTVRGPGVIKGFGLGLQVHDATDVTIEGVDFSDLDSGITARGADRIVIRENTFSSMPGHAVSIYGFDDGRTVLPTRDGVAFDNRFIDVGTGLHICGANATGHLLEHNVFEQIGDYGIHLETGTSNNIVSGNWFEQSLNTGIRITNSSNNILTGNYLEGGLTGIALHDNGGHISPACAAPMMPTVVTGNRLDGNYVGDFDVAIALGLGRDSLPRVIANRIEFSKLYFNTVGIRFHGDAWRNTAVHSAFHGTATPIIDIGTANVH